MEDHDPLPEYQSIDELDFSILPSRFRELPLFEDDLFLGMQAMNVGIVDPLVTQYEYNLLSEYIELEKTPGPEAMTVSALSQMWVFALYEVLRLWRSRHSDLKKWFANGGIDQKIKNMTEGADHNLTVYNRLHQMQRYKSDVAYRNDIDRARQHFDALWQSLESFRINLAKHEAPKKENLIPRAPGYGRINMMCGALDFEVMDSDGNYSTINRRQIADRLRRLVAEWG